MDHFSIKLNAELEIFIGMKNIAMQSWQILYRLLECAKKHLINTIIIIIIDNYF